MGKYKVVYVKDNKKDKVVYNANSSEEAEKMFNQDFSKVNSIIEIRSIVSEDDIKKSVKELLEKQKQKLSQVYTGAYYEEVNGNLILRNSKGDDEK